MDLILPEDVLEKQICSLCKKYLSCGPTKIYYENVVKCGRCSEQADNESSSLYEKLAKNLIFPCVNRFEGCNRLLRYEEVADHERVCVGLLYQCPQCLQDEYTPNSILNLLNHYKVNHSKYVLPKPEFHLSLNSPPDNNYYMYYDCSKNLFVIIYIYIHDNETLVNVFTVENRVERLKYRVTISVDGLEVFQSDFKKCANFNTDMLTLEPIKYLKDCTKLWFECTIDFDISEIIDASLLSKNYCASKTQQQEKNTWFFQIRILFLICLFFISIIMLNVYYCNSYKLENAIRESESCIVSLKTQLVCYDDFLYKKINDAPILADKNEKDRPGIDTREEKEDTYNINWPSVDTDNKKEEGDKMDMDNTSRIVLFALLSASILLSLWLSPITFIFMLFSLMYFMTQKS